MLLLRWTKLIVSDSRPRNPECCTPLPSQLGNRETHATVHFDQWFGCLKIGYPETFKSNGISSLNHWAHCPSKKNCNVRPFSRFFKPFSEKPIWRPPVLSHFSLVASLAQKMLKFSCFCFSCYGAVAFVKMCYSLPWKPWPIEIDDFSTRCYWKNVIFEFANCEITGSRGYPLNRLHSTMCQVISSGCQNPKKIKPISPMSLMRTWGMGFPQALGRQRCPLKLDQVKLDAAGTAPKALVSAQKGSLC